MGDKTDALMLKLSVYVMPYERFNPKTRKIEHVDGHWRSGHPAMVDILSMLRSYEVEKNYTTYSGFTTSKDAFAGWLSAYSQLDMDPTQQIQSTEFRDKLMGHMTPLVKFINSEKFKGLSKAQKTYVVKEFARMEALLRLSRLSSRLDSESISKADAAAELAYLADKFDEAKVGYFFEKSFPVEHKVLTNWYENVLVVAKAKGLDFPEASVKKPPTPTELDVKVKGEKGILKESWVGVEETVATLPNSYFERQNSEGDLIKTPINVGESLWVTTSDASHYEQDKGWGAATEPKTYWVRRANGQWVRYDSHKVYAKKLGKDKPEGIAPYPAEILTEGIKGKQKVISTAKKDKVVTAPKVENVPDTTTAPDTPQEDKLLSLPDFPEHTISVPWNSQVWVDDLDNPKEMWIQLKVGTSDSPSLWRHLWTDGKDSFDQNVWDADMGSDLHLTSQGESLPHGGWLLMGSDEDGQEPILWVPSEGEVMPTPETEHLYKDVASDLGPAPSWYVPATHENGIHDRLEPTERKGVYRATESFVMKKRSVGAFLPEALFVVSEGDYVVIAVPKAKGYMPYIEVLHESKDGKWFGVTSSRIEAQKHGMGLKTSWTGTDIEGHLDSITVDGNSIYAKNDWDDPIEFVLGQGLSYTPSEIDGVETDPDIRTAEWDIVPDTTPQGSVLEAFQDGLLEWDIFNLSEDANMPSYGGAKEAWGWRVTKAFTFVGPNGKTVKMEPGDGLMGKDGSSVLIWKADKGRMYAIRATATKLTKPYGSKYSVLWSATLGEEYDTKRPPLLHPNDAVSVNSITPVVPKTKGKKGPKTKAVAYPASFSHATPASVVTNGHAHMESNNVMVFDTPSIIYFPMGEGENFPVLVAPGDRILERENKDWNRTQFFIQRGDNALILSLDYDGTIITSSGDANLMPRAIHASGLNWEVPDAVLPTSFTVSSVTEPEFANDKGLLAQLALGNLVQDNSRTWTDPDVGERNFPGYTAVVKMTVLTGYDQLTLMPGDTIVGRDSTDLYVLRKNGEMYTTPKSGNKKMSKVTSLYGSLTSDTESVRFFGQQGGYAGGSTPITTPKMWNELMLDSGDHGQHGSMMVEFLPMEAAAPSGSAATTKAGVGGKRLAEMKALVEDIPAPSSLKAAVALGQKQNLEGLGSLEEYSESDVMWLRLSEWNIDDYSTPQFAGVSSMQGDSGSLPWPSVPIPASYNGKPLQSVMIRNTLDSNNKRVMQAMVGYGDGTNNEYFRFSWSPSHPGYSYTDNRRASIRHYGSLAEANGSDDNLTGSMEPDPWHPVKEVLQEKPTPGPEYPNAKDNIQLYPARMPAMGWTAMTQHGAALVQPGDRIYQVNVQDTNWDDGPTVIIVPKNPDHPVLRASISDWKGTDLVFVAVTEGPSPNNGTNQWWSSADAHSGIAKSIEEHDPQYTVAVRPEPSEEELVEGMIPLPDGSWLRVRAGDLVEYNSVEVRVTRMNSTFTEHYTVNGLQAEGEAGYSAFSLVSPDAMLTAEDVGKYPSVIRVPTTKGVRLVRLEEGQKAFMRYDTDEPLYKATTSMYQGNAVLVTNPDGSAYYFRTGGAPSMRTLDEVTTMMESGDWVEMENQLPQGAYIGEGEHPAGIALPSPTVVNAMGNTGALSQPEFKKFISRIEIPGVGTAKSHRDNFPMGTIIREDASRITVNYGADTGVYVMTPTEAGTNNSAVTPNATVASLYDEENASQFVVTMKTPRGPLSLLIPGKYDLDDMYIFRSTQNDKTMVYVHPKGDKEHWDLLQVVVNPGSGTFHTYQWSVWAGDLEALEAKKSLSIVPDSVVPMQKAEDDLIASVAKYDYGEDPFVTWEQVAQFISGMPLEKFLHAASQGNAEDAALYENILGRALLKFEATKKAHTDWDQNYKSKMTKMQNIITTLLRYSAAQRALADEPDEIDEATEQMLLQLPDYYDIDPQQHFLSISGPHADWFAGIRGVAAVFNERKMLIARAAEKGITDPDMQKAIYAWTQHDNVGMELDEWDTWEVVSLGQPYRLEFVHHMGDVEPEAVVSTKDMKEAFLTIIKNSQDPNDPMLDYLPWMTQEQQRRLVRNAMLGMSLGKSDVANTVKEAYQKSKTIDAMKLALADISAPTTTTIPDYVATEIFQSPGIRLHELYGAAARIDLRRRDDGLWQIVDAEAYDESGTSVIAVAANKFLNGDPTILKWTDTEILNLIQGEKQGTISVEPYDPDNEDMLYALEEKAVTEDELDAYLKDQGAQGMGYMTVQQKRDWAWCHARGYGTFAFLTEVEAYKANGKTHPDIATSPYSLETTEGKIRFKAFVDYYGNFYGTSQGGIFDDNADGDFLNLRLYMEEHGLVTLAESFAGSAFGGDIVVKPNDIDEQEWEFVLGLSQLHGDELAKALTELGNVAGKPWTPFPEHSPQAKDIIEEMVQTNYPTADPPLEVLWMLDFTVEQDRIKYLPNLLHFVNQDLKHGKYNKELPVGSFGAVELPDGTPYFLKEGETAVYIAADGDESLLGVMVYKPATQDEPTYFLKEGASLEGVAWHQTTALQAAYLDIEPVNVSLADVKKQLVVSKKKSAMAKKSNGQTGKFVDLQGVRFGPFPITTTSVSYMDEYGAALRFTATDEDGKNTVYAFYFDGVVEDASPELTLYEAVIDDYQEVTIESYSERQVSSSGLVGESLDTYFAQPQTMVDVSKLSAVQPNAGRIVAGNLWFASEDVHSEVQHYISVEPSSIGELHGNLEVVWYDGFPAIVSHDDAYELINEGGVLLASLMNNGYWWVPDDAMAGKVFMPKPSGIYYAEYGNLKQSTNGLSVGLVPVYYFGDLFEDQYLETVSAQFIPEYGHYKEAVSPGNAMTAWRRMGPTGREFVGTMILGAAEDVKAVEEGDWKPLDSWIDKYDEHIVAASFGISNVNVKASSDTGMTATLVKSAWDEMQKVEAATPADIQPVGASELMYWTEHDYNVFLYESGFSPEFLMTVPFTVRKWLGIALMQKGDEPKTAAAVAVAKEKFRLSGWGGKTTKPVFDPARPYTIYIAAGVPPEKWSSTTRDEFASDFNLSYHNPETVQDKLSELMSVTTAFVSEMKSKPKTKAKSAAHVDTKEVLEFTATSSSGGNKGSHHSGEMTDQYGRRWWVKPSRGDAHGALSNAQAEYRNTAEYGAALAFQLFGFKHPPCVLADIDATPIDSRCGGEKHPTFAHLYAPNKDDKGKALTLRRYSDIASLSDTQLIQLAQEHLGDWMMSQHDSHPDNMMLDAALNVFGIDKGQAFKFLGSDKLAVGYAPNPEPAVYDWLYQGIQNHKLTQEQAQLIALAVFRKAAYMAKHYDTEYAQLLKMVFDTASPTDSRAFGWEKRGFKSKEEVIQYLLERKHALLEDFFKLYKGIFDKAGYEFPWESTDDITRSVIEYPNSGEKAYVGVSQEYLEAINLTRGAGVPTFVSTEDLLGGTILSWEELDEDDSTILMMQGSVLPGATAEVEQWVTSQEVISDATGHPSQTTGATAKVLPMAEVWYGMLVTGAKTINGHQSDGDYNLDKIASMNSAIEQIALAKGALESWYAAHDDPDVYAAVLNVEGLHPIHFNDRAQMDAFYEMVLFYTDTGTHLKKCHEQHTKTYTDAGNKALPKFEYKPNDEVTKLTVEEKWSNETDIIEKLSNGVYKHTNLLTGEAQPIDEASALALIESMDTDETSNLGTIGGEAITLYKKKAGRPLVKWDFDKGIAKRTGDGDLSNQGEIWEIRVGDDIVIHYYPQSGALNNSTSQKGTLRIEIHNYDGSGERVQRAIDLLNEMGIDTTPADETALELMYWKMLAGTLDVRKLGPKEEALQKACKAVFAKMADLTPEDAIAEFKNAFAEYYGSMDYVDGIEWRPHFAHMDPQTQGASGGARWVHPDSAKMTYDDLTKIFEKRKFFGHTYKPDNSVTPIAIWKSGALVASAHRKRMFSATLGGVSTGSDDGTGGANGIFSWPKNDGPDVVFSPLVMFNLQSFVLPGDAFGNIDKRKLYTPFPLTEMLKVGTEGSHFGVGEWNLRYLVTMLDDVLCIRLSSSERETLLNLLKSWGVTEIRGVPIEQRIVTSIPSHAELLSMWKQEVEWRKKNGYQIGDMVV